MRGKLSQTLAPILVVVAAACGGGPTGNGSTSSGPACIPATQPEPKQQIQVRAASSGNATGRMYFIGQEKGFYAKQGISLNVQDVATTPEMVSLMASGQLDVAATGDAPAVWNAAEQGLGVKIVSDAVVNRDPKDPRYPVGVSGAAKLIVSRKLHDAGTLTSVKDLKGKTVAINNRGGAGQLILEKILDSAGLTLSDVNIVEVLYPDQLAAIANGKVDAAPTFEPFVSLGAAQRISVPILDWGEVIPNWPTQFIYFSGNFIKNQREAAQRALIAIMQALRYEEDAWVTGANRDEVVGYYVQHTALKTPALYRTLGVAFNETNGFIDTRYLQQDRDFFVKIGQLKGKTDVARVVDTSFGDCAVKVLGRYNGF